MSHQQRSKAEQGPTRSADSGADPRLTEEQALWREFSQATTPEQFYRGWLSIQCRLIPGLGSAVVVVGRPGTGPYSPAAAWPDGQADVQHLAPVIERALSQGQGLVLRRPGAPDATGPGRERLHVGYPIKLDGKLCGVVALDMASRPEAEMQAALRQIEWGSAWLELMQRRQVAVDAGAKERLQAVLDLVAGGLGQERFFAGATGFVTALATRLGCDRVSLGFHARGRARVRAVSHTAQPAKRTNLVRAIGAAMDESMEQQAAIVYPPPSGSPIRVLRAHEELSRQHGAGAICTVPFSEGPRMIGALTLERPAEHPFDPPTVELCEAVAALAGPMLELRRRDDRWLIGKAVAAGRQQLAHLIGPRHVALKVGVAAVVAAGLFLGFADGDYRVTAQTAMEASIRRVAVAPFNGYIREAPARAGDLVRRGQMLAVLDDRELRLERLKVQSQQEQLVKQHNLALANRNAAQVNIAAAQIDQARAQLALIDEQLGKTRVTAGFDGVVVTGDLSQSLGSPVERGQVLFEIAPLDAYRVVLQVDERDIADVTVGQRGQIVLAANPSDPIGFSVEKLTPVSTAREGRNYFRVEARLDRTPERLRPGMEGVGKIEVDRRLLVWIWLRPAVDWVRLFLWTWLP